MEKDVDGPILFVGEGDFSFSIAFRTKLSKCDMTSSCLLPEQELFATHKAAEENIGYLKELGVKICYEVDATRFIENEIIGHSRYFRIIFNFPHTGGKSNIKKNRELLKKFFSSVRDILGIGGDVCVTLAKGQGGTPMDQPVREWYDSWQVVAMATFSDFVLTRIRPFNTTNFVEYSSTGFRSLDKHFFTGDSMTHFFQHHTCPNVKPGAKELETFIIEDAHGNAYKTSNYIASKYKRKLLEIPSHPISRICSQLLEEMVTHNIGNVTYTDPIIKTPKSDVVSSVCIELNRYEDGETTELKLLPTVLENIKGHAHVADDSGAVWVGDVYRHPVDYDMCTLPVQHECGGLSSGQSGSDFQACLETLKSCLSKMLVDTEKTVRLTRATDIPAVYRSYFQDDCTYTIEIIGQSTNSFTTNACNQVCERGKPDPKRKLAKMTKFSRDIGYIGRVTTDSDQNKDSVIFVIVLESLAMSKYDIPDSRIFWSSNPKFETDYKAAEKNEYKFSPLSIFPPLWRHDLSFWDSDTKTFDERHLHSVIREVAGDVIKCVLLQSVWPEPKGGRISRCYRQIYQSFDWPISHARAHEFQNCVRLTVAREMDVTLR